MACLLDAMSSGRIRARCALVLSNRPDAQGLDLARRLGIPTAIVDHKASSSREEHDAKVVEALKEAGVDVVCLAGYMRLLSPVFVRAFRDRILNIHPALLPAFPGLHVQQQALDAGVRFSGCTVHLVDEEVDHGPVVLQAVVPILPADSEESLSRRILSYEHRLYPLALELVCEGRVTVEGPRTRLDLTPERYRTILESLIWNGDTP